MGVGAQHCPSGLHALWGLRAAGVVGGCPQGGWPATVVRGAWCQALSLPRPPVLWSGQPGFRDPCVPGAVGAGVGTQHRPHSVRPCGPALLAVGGAEGCPGGAAFHYCDGRLRSGAVPPPTARPKGGLLGPVTHVLLARVCGCGGPTLSPWPACPVGAACRGGCGGPSPGGVAWHRCEGRLVSGAVPPPAARPLERAARVPRPVCPGCGRCGRGDPAPAPQRAPFRAGLARCGGGGRASPGWVPSTILRGVCGQALSLPRLPAHWAGSWGPPPTCCGRGCVGVGAQHCPLCLHALWELRTAGVVGGRPWGGWPATVVRGPWRQTLSLPRPRVLWSGPPGFRDPCVPGAAGAGVGTQHRPHSVRPSGPALIAVGVAEGRPRGGCLPPLWGASEVRRCPSPDCRPTGRAVGVRHPVAVGAGVLVWEPNTVPSACMPCGGCMPRGWWGAVPGGAGLPPL